MNGTNQLKMERLTPIEFINLKFNDNENSRFLKKITEGDLLGSLGWQEIVANLMNEYADHCKESFEEDAIQCDCGRLAEREFYDTYGRCEFCESVDLEVEKRIARQEIK